MDTQDIDRKARRAAVREALDRRSIVLVGLMGAGKSAIGRRIAQELELPFVDADTEIETVSRMTIPELFERYGEPEFRSLEKRVIARILKGGPQVLATGGGAYMNDQTRRAIGRRGVSVWLSADIDLLMARVAKKQNRPLLKTADPRAVMQKLMADRYPVYALADIEVKSRDIGKDEMAEEVMREIAAWIERPKERETRG